MIGRQTGRGRLSSINLLPPDAQPIVAWAFDELRKQERHQIDIHAEFNRKLAELAADTGLKIRPISLSAFNRKSVRLATSARRLEEASEIAKVLADKRAPADIDNLTIMLSQYVKTLALELLEGAGEGGFTPKETMEIARAIQAVTSAESTSAKRRKEVQDEIDAKTKKAVDEVGRKKGLSAETVEAIKRRILGIQPEGEDEE